jgi:hypothetical protein
MTMIELDPEDKQKRIDRIMDLTNLRYRQLKIYYLWIKIQSIGKLHLNIFRLG